MLASAISGARRRSRARSQKLVVDTWRTKLDPLGVGAFEKQRRASAFCGWQKEVGFGEHSPTVRTRPDIAVRVDERDRLPHRQDELVAELAPVLGGLHRVPKAEVLRVHDVETTEQPPWPQVAIARDACELVSDAAWRQ